MICVGSTEHGIFYDSPLRLSRSVSGVTRESPPGADVGNLPKMPPLAPLRGEKINKRKVSTAEMAARMRLRKRRPERADCPPPPPSNRKLQDPELPRPIQSAHYARDHRVPRRIEALREFESWRAFSKWKA